jgi:hypothetical protein
MTTGARVLLIVVGGVVLLAFASVAMAAAAIYGSGTIAVDVRDGAGTDVSVHVPAALANVALGLVPDSLVEEALRDAPPEVEPILPAVRDAWRELEESRDFVLVQVVDGDDSLRVEKRGKQLVVRVEFDDGDVHVTVPLKTVRKLVRKVS